MFTKLEWYQKDNDYYCITLTYDLLMKVLERKLKTTQVMKSERVGNIRLWKLNDNAVYPIFVFVFHPERKVLNH